MSNKLRMGGDFFSQLAAREPFSRRMRRLFERGIIAALSGDSATVNVGRREDGSDILLEQVPIVSGYNPQVGDWVSLRYDGGHGGAPMVFGPSLSDESETEPDTSNPEVVAARSSARYGAHATLDARLEEHEQDATDPHGASLTQTVKLRAPLVDAAGDLQLLPGSSGAVIVADTAPGGVLRPLVIADAGLLSRDSNEALKVAAGADYAISGNTYLVTVDFDPANSDSSRVMGGAQVALTLSGNNTAAANSEALQVTLTLNTDAALPDPLPGAGNHPMSGLDLNFGAGLNHFGGSITRLVGLLLHPGYTNAVYNSGLISELYGIMGLDTIQKSRVDTFAWLNLPKVRSTTDDPAGHVTYPYQIIFGGGKCRLDDDLTWYAGDGTTQIVHFFTAGRLGLGTTSPAYLLDLATVSGYDGVRMTAYGTEYDSLNFRRARGTPAAPSATQSNDALGAFWGIGYGGTGWNGASAGMAFIATQNFTDATAGTLISFSCTANGSTTRKIVAGLSFDGTHSRFYSPQANMIVYSSVAGYGGVLALRLTNKSPSDMSAGDIAVSTGTDYAFTAASGANNLTTLGILLEDIAVNASGLVAVAGGPVAVNCDTVAVSRGNHLGTSAGLTGKATPTTTAGGKLVIALTSKGSGGQGVVYGVVVNR